MFSDTLCQLANPAHPTNPAKAAWYFMGLQELLLHMHPLAAMLLGVLLVIGMLWTLAANLCLLPALLELRERRRGDSQ